MYLKCHSPSSSLSFKPQREENVMQVQTVNSKLAFVVSQEACKAQKNCKATRVEKKHPISTCTG